MKNLELCECRHEKESHNANYQGIEDTCDTCKCLFFRPKKEKKGIYPSKEFPNPLTHEPYKKDEQYFQGFHIEFAEGTSEEEKEMILKSLNPEPQDIRGWEERFDEFYKYNGPDGWETKNIKRFIAEEIKKEKEAYGEIRYEAGKKEEKKQWSNWGVIEVAVRNPQVAEYCKHWESRAEKEVKEAVENFRKQAIEAVQNQIKLTNAVYTEGDRIGESMNIFAGKKLKKIIKILNDIKA